MDLIKKRNNHVTTFFLCVILFFMFCPLIFASKGMLNNLPYTKPYADYCGHCDLLYSRVAKQYGIEITGDYSNVDKACCKLVGRKIKE